MSPNEENQLAIVIPAYKAHFLRQALKSISQQTDKRFTVYVGDDASPDDIKGICEEFVDRFDLVYKRFNENQGRDSLVAHWHRCIELSSGSWIWLFCDDDIMEPRCVEMFYKTIELTNGRFKVLRFNTLTIDDNGKVTRINPIHPEIESGIGFIVSRLKGERASFVTEYIFSRETYIENGGIIEFPLAWASDDASWLTFSQKEGILTIQGAKVRWRSGAYNISPPGPKYQTMRIEAAFKFVNWLDNFIQINGTGDPNLTSDKIHELSTKWFLQQFRSITPIRITNYKKFSRFINATTKKGWVFSYKFLLIIDIAFRTHKFFKSRNNPIYRILEKGGRILFHY